MKKFISFTIVSLLAFSINNAIAKDANLLSHQKDFASCNNYGKYAQVLYNGVDAQKLLRRAMQLCYNEFFSFYDPRVKTPLWTFEVITSKSDTKLERKDNFGPDPLVPYNAQPKLSDYARSGFDRGHMAPAANMTTEESMSQSFYLTNMVPQVGPNMNRGIWADLEETARAFARKEPEVVVVTGPVFSSTTAVTVGKNQVYVPSHLFKIIYLPRTKEAKYYIMPNVQIVTRKTKSLDTGNPSYPQTTPAAAVNCSKVCNSENFRVKEEDFVKNTAWKFNFK